MHVAGSKAGEGSFMPIDTKAPDIEIWDLVFALLKFWSCFCPEFPNYAPIPLLWSGNARSVSLYTKSI